MRDSGVPLQMINGRNDLVAGVRWVRKLAKALSCPLTLTGALPPCSSSSPKPYSLVRTHLTTPALSALQACRLRGLAHPHPHSALPLCSFRDIKQSTLSHIELASPLTHLWYARGRQSPRSVEAHTPDHDGFVCSASPPLERPRMWVALPMFQDCLPCGV